MQGKAFAKLNLFLSVTGTRPDGYHNIDSVMQQVTLADIVTIEKGAQIRLTCSDPTLPTDRKNLAYRAAEAFFAATGISGGATIHLEKLIPMEAGLAGGSTDAAVVLSLLNELYDTKLSTDALCAIGGTLGADIPFCIRGGTARTEGIGEIITPCASLPPCSILIAIGSVGVSTKEAYALVDQNPVPPRSADAMLAALTAGSLAAVRDAAYNVFSAVAPACVEPLRQRILSLGADLAMMSGTGSSVFGCFASEDKAKEAKNTLIAEGYRAFLCSPICS